MESFFWVLLYICITRPGPGGAQRKELTEDISAISEPDCDKAMEVRRIVYCFFDADLDTIASNKRDLFQIHNLFEDRLLPYIHDYFENSLKAVLRQWWQLLLLAYEFGGYEYHNIHVFVMDLLEKALEKIRHPLTHEPTDDAQQMLDAMKNRSDFVPGVTHVDSSVQASQLGTAESPLSPTAHQFTPAFDGTPESPSQKQQAVGARDISPSPPSPTPTQKKRKKKCH
ncbi:hypothetical protein C2E23DRAFT_905548 [Lenzites betulinus]|nr:hypothetical protein C2E23DRAFT_905548 [Lenzites betulinus]